MYSLYFDNAATTPVSKEVFDEMRPFFEDLYGNPSSIYEIGAKSKQALDAARLKVANAIGASPKEIFFTNGGTEADNWAIKGVCELNSKKGKHIITSAFEHHAVLHTCQHLEKFGFEATYVDVNENGVINAEDVEKAIRPDTILITIMYANNEIGTLQPIKEIGAIARKHDIIFHTDAVQAVGSVPIDVALENIDLLSLSAHKLNGPKGTGALFIKKGLRLPPLLHGGAQENRKRAGTENVAGIVGLGRAIELKQASLEQEMSRLTALRNRLIDGIFQTISHVKLNGDREKRLPGNANISFEFIEGESLLLLLDAKGAAASSGSACTSGSLDPSHVLLSLGMGHEQAHGSLRLTLGKYTTEDDVAKMIEILPPIVEKLRKMSPLYEDYLKNQQ